MKRFFSAILVLALCFAFTACSGNSNSSTSGDNTVSGVSDLPGKKIAVQIGTTGDVYATKYEQEGSTLERYNKSVDAIQALKQNKVDCVVIDEQPAKVYAAANSDLKILDEPLEKEDYAICVSKDKPELTAELNKALATIKANGVLDKIIGNYIGDDTKGTYQYQSPENTDRSKGTLVMATYTGFEPYEYVEGDKIAGIDPDVALALCDIMGYELKIEDMEFSSIINAVQSGKADMGISGMTVTEDRKKNIDFTDPYTTATQVIIVKK